MKLLLWRSAQVLIFLSIAASARIGLAQPDDGRANVSASRQLQIGGASLQIDIARGSFDLPQSEILGRIETAAHAVTAYYGRFPVSRARILVIPVAGEHGVLQGTTWGGVDGFSGFTRLRIGEHTTKAELREDWIITHELVHMAFASQPDDLHWLEEGLATYIEPIARAQAGELTAERVWGDMVAGMPNGEPAPRDRGMNRTHTWGRTYWGGAMFCLVADVEIRRQTNNQKGLQDALRAIVLAGGTIDTSRPVQQLFQTGDQATGTHVLEEMYRQWSETPVPVDLDQLWRQLGIESRQGRLTFNSVAPLSAIRVRLTAPRETFDPVRVGTPAVPSAAGVGPNRK